MNKKTLEAWLTHIKTVNSQEIDLNLTRVKAVASRLHLLHFTCPVIIVGGTNGKGSTVAGLEAIYRAAGYAVGAFSSPYLIRYNEQFRINSLPVTDEKLCEAFAEVDKNKSGFALTPFEYGTLVALYLFHSANLEVCILEVGLGGRLDAVNIIEADLAIVTSISLDHTDWLGETRDAIATEKAGIFRPNKKAICGDFNPPATLFAHKKDIYCQGKQFGFRLENSTSWQFWTQEKKINNLPLPALALQNMACVLMAVELLNDCLPVTRYQIDVALQKVVLAGRIQELRKNPTIIVDVSHNPASIELLAFYLENNPVEGKTRAIFSMLADKNIPESIKKIEALIDYWYVAPLKAPRAASYALLKECFEQRNIKNSYFADSIFEATHSANQVTLEKDRLVIFGSFSTVAEYLSFN